LLEFGRRELGTGVRPNMGYIQVTIVSNMTMISLVSSKCVNDTC
jgi:hypothetical protein